MQIVNIKIEINIFINFYTYDRQNAGCPPPPPLITDWKKKCNCRPIGISAKNSNNSLQCVYILPISARCDLQEINVVSVDTMVQTPPMSGKYQKQTYTENGKPWYKHVSEVCRHFY